MSVSERLKKLVISSKKSATQLAKELGITQSAFNKAIKGDVMPSSKILIPLAKMGININWLLVGDGVMWNKETDKNKQTGGNKEDDSKIQQLTTEIKHLKKEIEVLEVANTSLSSQIKDKEMIISLLQKK